MHNPTENNLNPLSENRPIWDLELLQFFLFTFRLDEAIRTAPVEKRIFEVGISRRAGELIPRGVQPTPWLCGRKTPNLTEKRGIA